MAEIEVKGKKPTPRVDLTPMVDLNLLLITFFMFATTLNKPKAMEINMPAKIEDQSQQSEVKKSTALTILLSKDNKIYYYHGIGDDANERPDVKQTSFKEIDGIRSVLIEKKKMVQDLINQGQLLSTDKPTIIIKPDYDSKTDDLINILDEMTINAIPIYAVVDITEVDQQFIQEVQGAN